MEWWLWLTVVFFLGGLVYSLIAISNATGNNDSKSDMYQAMTNVTIVNAVLVLILAGAGYFYTEQYPTAREPYIMAMLHLGLLLSVISVSISSLYSVSK